MPGNRTNRLPAVGLLLCLVIMLMVVPVSALNSIDEELIEYIDTGVQISAQAVTPPTPQDYMMEWITFKNIQNHTNLAYIGIVVPAYEHCEFKLPEGVTECTYTLHDFPEKPATIHTEYERNLVGTVTKMRLVIFFDEWDIGTLTGKKTIQFSKPLWRGKPVPGLRSDIGVLPDLWQDYEYSGPYTLTVASNIVWKNRIQIDELEFGGYDVWLTREYPDDGGPVNGNSQINLCKDNVVTFYNEHINDFYTRTMPGEIDEIQLISPSKTYTWPLGGATTTNATVTVYIRNSQTGALLADASLSILAATGGNETEFINATLPGGTGTYTLQPTGGGFPNPDYYRAVATVPGYTQIVENHSFTLNGPHDVIIEMRPDSGGPLDPERAYLEFYVRDLNANPIPAASIQCGGRILQTNSAGYAVFEVSKNSTHPWIAKKSGYTTIEGTATTGPNPRYVVNVVLGPGTVPTYTPAPGETPGGPGATPTPDRRTNEEKGQSIIDMIADNAEPLAVLALLGTFLGLFKLMAKW